MRYFILLSVLIGFSSCYKVERNCETYKTGSFYSKIVVDDIAYISRFTRTKDLQIEIFGSKIDSSKVRWINDCEMIFKTINPKNRIEKKDIHLKILSTTDSSYTFEYSYVGDNQKQKGIAYKN